ncbi:MAG: SDR family NAD(P)-dependent oxidoreductase [Lachnospiraceae bacterium]|nr:SDR family NAD(P)-dependent oxidoreductase [Lachnospiraceae bacterium]
MKRYLVTGAAGGMGKAVCRALTDAGAEVWGLDLSAEEGDPRMIRADVTDPASLEAASMRVRAEAGTLDGIVHTAGIYNLASLVELPEEAFLRIFDINLFGIYRTNRIFLPLLGEGGRIVMVSSELAPLDPLPFTGIYAITKSAVEKYAASLRMELQLLGFSVSVIRPGAVDTGMLPASTAALERFSAETKLYPDSAGRFRHIVDSVESRAVPPGKVAEAALEALTAPRPKLVYNLNRNPLLRLLDALPQRLQLLVIRKILKG